MSDGYAIQLEEVSFRYEGEAGHALRGLSFAVLQGEWVAVIGRSGSGKSTLCQLLNGYLPRSGGGNREGTLKVGGLDPLHASIAEMANTCGLVFQDPDAQLVQGIVEDEVAFGPENLCLAPSVIMERISDALQAVSLTELRDERITALSGGQKQRTAISAILALAPPILVLDAATSSLDPPAQQQLVQLCAALHQQGRTLLTSSGRFDDQARHASRVIVLDEGTVRFDGPPEVLLRDHHAELTALGLLPQPGRMPAAIGWQPSGEPPLLNMRGLSFTYPGGHKALQEVNGTLSAGQWTVLTGDNGSGKTTLSRLLMGLLPVPKGALFLVGKELARYDASDLSSKIGYVFQQPEHQFVASTVWEECTYDIRASLASRENTDIPPEWKSKVEELLKLAGLSHKKEASPYSLGGGEKRLLSVITQFLLDKSIYVLDEPSAGMDYIGMEILTGLCQLQLSKGAAILMITHDPHYFLPYADQHWELDRGILKKHNSFHEK
ncbi:ABC transporter ATP-binding protein [Paenibacillus sp. Marseille-Q4541]|uniref:ABC transporter ATP-binding protein n=1 Tax=Paenibacillus sp. Marseille-Q4541 TaxID=2831522 RepID=UPI001BAB9FDC|nr:ABC transporter ATP-binding protein [Paenibacillus sp. Marseille-Q4541]